MDEFKLLSSLPHHSKMGKFENPKSAPVWEAQHGFNYGTELLLDAAASLEAAARRNQGVEWGDVRSRHIDNSRAIFLRFVVGLRAG